MRALNCYPDVSCVLEPFTPANLSTKYGNITEASALEEALGDIWREHNGIKHVWHPAGWPFGATPELNYRLLRTADVQIIVLTRKNDLRRVVSSEISWQTSVWGRFTEEERERVRGFDYQPFSPQKIEHQLRAVANGVAELRRMLHDASISFFDLRYEDLFGEDVYLADRLRIMDQIRGFVGASREVEADFAIADLLNPATSKLNLVETYKRIPNIDEIERRFGSDESGWLFRDSRRG